MLPAAQNRYGPVAHQHQTFVVMCSFERSRQRVQATREHYDAGNAIKWPIVQLPELHIRLSRRQICHWHKVERELVIGKKAKGCDERTRNVTTPPKVRITNWHDEVEVPVPRLSGVVVCPFAASFGRAVRSEYVGGNFKKILQPMGEVLIKYLREVFKANVNVGMQSVSAQVDWMAVAPSRVVPFHNRASAEDEAWLNHAPLPAS